MKKKIILFAAVVLSLIGLGLAVALPAGAASDITVNSVLDEHDATPNDGHCASTPSGVCTLRAAIEESNASAAVETIHLAANTNYKLSLGGLSMIDEATIVGGGKSTIINADGKSQVMYINFKTKVTLSKLMVQGGKAANGGGLYNEGVLYLESATVSANNADDNGGGIFNDGTLFVHFSSVMSNNAGDFGGGIYNNAVNADIYNSLVYDNHALESHGGAFYNRGGALLTVLNSTVYENTADEYGGALFNEPGAQAYFSNATVAGNTGDAGNHNFGDGGAIYNNEANGTDGTVTIKETILDDNKLRTASAVLDDCGGNIKDEGYNLIRTKNTCTIVNQKSTTKIGVNSKLGALGDNGGDTYTVTLLSESPAIDVGDHLGCQDHFNNPINRDQRNFVRPVDGDGVGGSACDIGAFERGASAATPTPTNTKAPTKTTVPTKTPAPTKTATPGPCSGIKPDKPILKSPAKGKSITDTTPKLKWSAAKCADTYELTVKQDSKQNKPIIKQVGLTTTNYTTTTLEKGHTYYWRVKACDKAGCKASATFSFKLKQ